MKAFQPSMSSLIYSPRRFTAAFAPMALLLMSACAGSGTAVTATTPPLTARTAQVARSQFGMVASASIFATEIGARVLAQGGNAVDAAVATSLALAVTEPNMSGLGGRTSIVVRTPDGAVFGLDGVNKVPTNFVNGAPPGYATAAIPGVPAALSVLMKRYGSRNISDLVAPALQLAENGFPVPAHTAAFISDAADDLRQFPASRRYFFRADGSLLQAGDTLVQKDLARTLRALADSGLDYFYRGWIADSIDADMVRAGGFINRAELAAYEAVPAILVRGSYRGFGIVSNFAPASGQAVIEALQIMEHFTLRGRSNVEYSSIVGQAMQLALSDRSRSEGSPEESARFLTSSAFAAERAKDVGDPRPPPALSPEEAPWWFRPDQDHTTHLSVVDASGMAVALTQSLGPSMGTRLAASGVGILYATRLGSQPGSRPASTISPTIVTDSAGRLRYVLGAAGDARIITAVIQTLSRAIDQQLPLDRAVAAPRVHPMGRASLRVEYDTRIGWSLADLASFRALGFQVDSAPSTYFARIHAVEVDAESRRLMGVAEPRGAGTASGPARAPGGGM